ncbi:SWIM zinc finger family protein [Streptomyces sp. NPDC093970]|uniref:SWIM zinc finger family protein n=1 Tax=Streptomyces sp. NPDC093970 TaxID=3155076 RepID=UPI003448FDA9
MSEDGQRPGDAARRALRATLGRGAETGGDATATAAGQRTPGPADAARLALRAAAASKRTERRDTESDTGADPGGADTGAEAGTAGADGIDPGGAAVAPDAGPADGVRSVPGAGREDAAAPAPGAVRPGARPGDAAREALRAARAQARRAEAAAAAALEEAQAPAARRLPVPAPAATTRGRTARDLKQFLATAFRMPPEETDPEETDPEETDLEETDLAKTEPQGPETANSPAAPAAPLDEDRPRPAATRRTESNPVPADQSRTTAAPVPAAPAGRRDPETSVPATSAGRRDSDASVPAAPAGRRDSDASVPATSAGPRDSDTSVPATSAGPRDSDTSVPATSTGPRDPGTPVPATPAGRRDSDTSVPATSTGRRDADTPLPATPAGRRDPATPVPATPAGLPEPGTPVPAATPGPRDPVESVVAAEGEPGSGAGAPRVPRTMASPHRDTELRRTFPALKARAAAGAEFAGTWWGNAWVRALEEGALDVSRLARGRGYAERGHVDAITVTPGLVLAYVQGSRPRPYRVQVRLRTFGEDEWERFLEAAADRPGDIAALLDRELPQALAESGVSLLPGPGELEPRCSCPDFGHPCKHAAALCYQTARLLDADPFVLLLLRGRGEREVLDALSRRNAARAARERQPVSLPGVRATEALAPRRLPALPAPLPVPPHPGQPPVYPGVPGGPDPFTLDQLACDAAARAHALLATGRDPVGELTLWQDAVRLAAARPGSGLTASTRALYAALAAAVGRSPGDLARAVAAWRQGGHEGLAALEEPWDPPAGRFDRARPLLLAADLPAFRPWRNRLTHPGGHVQLRLGRDGLWYAYESEPGDDDWWPRGTPDLDPVGALTGLGSEDGL